MRGSIILEFVAVGTICVLLSGYEEWGVAPSLLAWVDDTWRDTLHLVSVLPTSEHHAVQQSYSVSLDRMPIKDRHAALFRALSIS